MPSKFAAREADSRLHNSISHCIRMVFSFAFVLGMSSELLGPVFTVDCNANSLTVQHICEVFRWSFLLLQLLLSSVCTVSSSMFPNL